MASFPNRIAGTSDTSHPLHALHAPRTFQLNHSKILRLNHIFKFVIPRFYDFFMGNFVYHFSRLSCTSISCFMYPLTYFVYYDAKSLVFLSVIFPQHFSLPLYSLFHSTWTSLFLLRFSTTFGCLINETANYKLQTTKHCEHKTLQNTRNKLVRQQLRRCHAHEPAPGAELAPDPGPERDPSL